MNVEDFMGEPEMEMTKAEMCLRIQKLEQLVGLLFRRIEEETGEELLVTAANTARGYIPTFGPTGAEKQKFCLTSRRNFEPCREELDREGWRKVDGDLFPIRMNWKHTGEMQRFDDPLSAEYQAAAYEVEIWVRKDDPSQAMGLLVPRVVTP